LIFVLVRILSTRNVLNTSDQDVALWPEDCESGATNAGEPDTQLAVALLAAGMTQSYIRTKCGFRTARECAAFCRDEDVRREASELAGDRVRRLGRLATVGLEKILRTPQTDLRAFVLALRTALEVSGELRRDHSPAVKRVPELTSVELGELIAATRSELESRISRRRQDVERIGAESAAESGT
jgi:hypothetical protein